MPVTVTCECSNSFSLKDEFAGSMVKCPACGAAVRAGTTQFTPESSADPVFGRDIFLLRQKMLRISDKYDVCDEPGQPIVYVERPAHLGRNLLAVLAGIAAGGVWLFLLVSRLLGPMLGFLRTNFVFHRAGSDRVIGEFKRKLTLFDRYVLDLTADRERAFDRRVALALGVMLDTGERR
jgi:hypothetical protein